MLERHHAAGAKTDPGPATDEHDTPGQYEKQKTA
jgi:hypothetical protein